MRKHQTWLWAFIITIVIISFVIFFSPNANLDMFGGQGGYDFGSIKGKPITREQLTEARDEVVLFFFARYRQWPTEEVTRMAGFDVDTETYNRLAMIEKLKQMRVDVSEEATAQMIKEIFSGRDGKFAMETYENFIREIGSRGFTREVFERLIRHEVGQQHLVATYGLGGKLITPQEAEYLFKRDNESLTVDAVFFSGSNYLSQVTVNETNAQYFFEQNMAQYRVPDRIQVKYVKLDGSNYLAKADETVAKMTNMPQIVEAIYRQRGGTNFFKDDSGRGLLLPEATPKIKELIRMDVALGEAKKTAADFITAAFTASESAPTVAEKLAAFEKAAESSSLKVVETPAFDQSMVSNELTNLPPEVKSAAFRLSEEEPITPSPITTDDAVYVVALKQQIPGRNSKFSEVKDKVLADFKENEARRMARTAGQKFSENLEKGLSGGRSFTSIAAEENVKPVALPAFSLTTRSLPELKDRLDLNRLQNAAGRLGEGKSTDLMATEDGGVVLFLRKRTAVADDRLQRELPEFARGMAEQRQYTAYGHWLRQLPEEMQMNRPTPPPTANQ